MAKRPEGMDREEWLAARQKVWRRRNAVLNVLMVVVVVAIYLRSCT